MSSRAALQRRPAPAATVIAVAAALLLALVGASVSVWARWPSAGRGDSVAMAVTVAVFVFTGAVLSLARPDNRIGGLLVVGATAWGVGLGLVDTAYRELTFPAIGTGSGAASGAGRAVDWLAEVGSPLRGVGWLVLAVAVPALFPDGQLPGPRWRWLGALIAATLATSTIGAALAGDLENNELRSAGFHTPLPPGFAAVGDALATLALPLLAASIIGIVVAMVARSRLGPTALRRQLLVVGLAAVLPVVVIPTAFTGGLPSWVFVVSVVPIPIAAAVAIFTGGVFDLATVANRSLVWALLTGAVVGLYALIVAGTAAIVGDGHDRLITWLAVGAVAVSFAPLRQGLQRAINRITFGRWREPYEVLAALGQRVEAAADVDRLPADVVAELAASLGLRDVALLDTHGNAVAATAGGTAAVDRVTLPLTAYGHPVGSLSFVEPATALRPDDRRLLDDLAAQLGALLHARALTADLRRARDGLVRAREEERRRLRRDLHDGLGPTLAAMMLRVDTALALLDTDAAATRRDLVGLRDDIRDTVVDVRRLVEGLRPPAVDEVGLAQALRQAVERIAGRQLTVGVDVTTPAALPAAVEVAAYRIVSEAVTNVVRHAHADACQVAVTHRGADLVVSVRDNGQGLQAVPSSAGHGLSTMRERAEELGGLLSIVEEDGVVVTAVLPLWGHREET